MRLSVRASDYSNVAGASSYTRSFFINVNSNTTYAAQTGPSIVSSSDTSLELPPEVTVAGRPYELNIADKLPDEDKAAFRYALAVHINLLSHFQVSLAQSRITTQTHK